MGRGGISYGQFAFILMGIIILDSILTVAVGVEANHIYLWMMNKWGYTLEQLMFWRIPVLGVLIYFIYKFGTSTINIKHATFLYLGLYLVLVVSQFYQYVF